MLAHDPFAPRPIRALFVDVGGVVVVPNGATIAAAMEAAAPGVIVDATAADRAHHVGIAALDAGVRGGTDPSWAAYFAAWAMVAGVDPGHLRSVVPAALGLMSLPSDGVWDEVRPGAHEGLAVLAELDIPLIVVSNSDGRVEVLLQRLELCQVGAGSGTEFRAILDSHIVGSTKPHAGIFLMACEIAGVEPADTAHIGDTECMDIVGAMAAGVRPVHIDPHGLAMGVEDGVDRVADLAGLAALVRRSWA